MVGGLVGLFLLGPLPAFAVTDCTTGFDQYNQGLLQVCLGIKSIDAELASILAVASLFDTDTVYFFLGVAGGFAFLLGVKARL